MPNIHHGQQNERELTAFLLQKLASDESVKNFSLSSSNDSEKFGKFDDHVLKVHFKDGNVHLLAIQEKHIANKSWLTVNKLNAVDKDAYFGIPVYLNSYLECYQHLKDYQLVLHTNAMIKSNISTLTITLTLEDRPQFEVLLEKKSGERLCNTSKSKEFYQFNLDNVTIDDERIQRFLANFTLMANQVSTLRKKNFNNFAENFFYTEEDFVQFSISLTKWHAKTVKKPELDKVVFADLLIEPHIINPEEDVDTSGRYRDLKAAILKFDLTLIEQVDDEILVQLATECKSDSLRFIKFDESKQKKILKAVSLYLENVPRMKVVLCGENIPKYLFGGYKTFQNLSDLNSIDSDLYKIITIVVQCSIQGKDEVDLEAIIAENNDIRSALTTSQLVTMMSTFFNIGDEKLILPNSYIDRTLSKIFIDLKYIPQAPDDNVIVIGNFKKLKPPTDIYLKNVNIIDYNLKESDQGEDKLFAKDVITNDFEFTMEDFQAISKKYRKKKCHLFRATNDGYLEWLTSSCGIGDLLEYRRQENDLLQESDLSKYDHNKINIICGPSGSGKTTMAKYCRNNCPSTSYAILINSREVSHNFRGISDGNKFLQQFLEQYYNKLNHSSFERNLIDCFKDSGRIVLVWDGLDEVSSTNLPNILKVIQDLSKLRIVRWPPQNLGHKNLPGVKLASVPNCKFGKLAYLDIVTCRSSPIYPAPLETYLLFMVVNAFVSFVTTLYLELKVKPFP